MSAWPPRWEYREPRRERFRDPFDVAPAVASWRSPEALARIRELLAEGIEVCSCQPRPSRIDDDGVLVCPACAGIDAGQVDDAEGLR